VGVLKVLEREQIPIDAITQDFDGRDHWRALRQRPGAAELERELLALDWARCSPTDCRATRSASAARRRISRSLQRWKKLGIGRVSGELMLPIGSVSSRGLELLLRRALPVRQSPSFDALPIPLRAVATVPGNPKPQNPWFNV